MKKEKLKSMKMFLDSGAHSLFKEHVGTSNLRDYSFFESDKFWQFVDEYALFIKANEQLIDVYVSLDVIFNPELSWKVQKYLERKHKLKPLPVFHAGEDFKWLKKYIDNYDYVGIGGLGQSVTKVQWIFNVGDPAFTLICDTKNHMPRVKTHGFAMTSPDLILTYPFFSVDSTSWMQFGKYGLLIVPKKINNKFDYRKSPTIVLVSQRKGQQAKAEHFNSMPKQEQKHIIEYIESNGYKLGKSELEKVPFDKSKVAFPVSTHEYSEKETIIEEGVCNNGNMRDMLNLQYYLNLEKHSRPYPWAWSPERKQTRFIDL
jgi:hypothetical protein